MKYEASDVQSPPSIVVRTALLIGAEQAGKSTLIDCLASYFQGSKPHSPYIIIPKSTLSETTFCATYAFLRNSVLYRFIDTPGIKDSGDAEEAIEAAADQAIMLHAIVWVINGSASTPRADMQPVLRRLEAKYPGILPNNMLVVYTHISSALTYFKVQDLPIQQAFVMNNSAFCTSPLLWSKEEISSEEKNWEKAMKAITEMLSVLEGLPMQLTTSLICSSKLEPSEFIPTEADMYDILTETLASLAESEQTELSPAALPEVTDEDNVRTVLLLGDTGRSSSLIPSLAKGLCGTIEPLEVDEGQEFTIYYCKGGDNAYCFIAPQELPSSDDDRLVEETLSEVRQAGDLWAVILVIESLSERVESSLQAVMRPIEASYPNVAHNNLMCVYSNEALKVQSLVTGFLPYSSAKSFVMSPSASQFHDTAQISMVTTENIIAQLDQFAPHEMTVQPDLLRQLNEIKGNILGTAVEMERQTLRIEMLERRNQEEARIKAILSEHEIRQKIDNSGVLNSLGEASTLQILPLIRQFNVLKSPPPPQRLCTRRVEKSYHSTLCSVCRTTCHEECGLDYTTMVGHNIFKQCSCMSNEKCNKCGCNYMMHVHDRAEYVKEMVTEVSESENIAVECLRKQAKVRELEIKIAFLEEQEKIRCEYNRSAQTGSQSDEMREQTADILLAKQQLLDITNQRSQIEMDISKAQQAMQLTQAAIEAKCQELKNRCPRRVFLEELHVTQEVVRASVRSLETVTVKESITSFVGELGKLASRRGVNRTR